MNVKTKHNTMLQWKITVIKSIDKIRFTDNDVVHMIRRSGIFWYGWGDVDICWRFLNEM